MDHSTWEKMGDQWEDPCGSPVARDGGGSP
jgi:hypothetical protein